MALDDIFDRIYEQYYRLMYQVAYGILQNTEDTEDVLQESFIRIEKNISKISDIECPKTRGFLVIIVERKAIDILRNRKKETNEELIEDKAGSILPDLGEHDLKWCIDQLPPRYREIILLKYSHGYSTREISEILGISFDAASKLDQRAKKRLEDLCRKEGIL